MTKEEFGEMASIGIDTTRMVHFVEYNGRRFYSCDDLIKMENNHISSLESEIRELREKLGVAVEALDYYSKRTPNRRAREALSRIMGGE